jgi:SNF2 family DNA or RNA helicase
LSKIKWKRIIIDEAHIIRNRGAKSNKALCELKSKYRLLLTGTPVHNSLNDLYSLIKFMNFEPLNNFSLWKYFFPSKSSKKVRPIELEKLAEILLQLIVDYLILRRTKLDKFPGKDKCIVDLPEKKVEEVRFKLGTNEKIIYQQIFNEFKEKANRLLVDKSDKNNNYIVIFVYLLRLRQACCHMSLLAECIDQEQIGNLEFDEDGSIVSDGSSFDTDHGNEISTKSKIISDGKDLETLEKINSSFDLLKCLEKSYMSSKITKSLSIINELLIKFPNDKLIIVSQWTSMLAIIGEKLKKQKIDYCEIKGKVSLIKRNEIVNKFNDKSNYEQQVMLLSLCAGGVGLVVI